MYLVEIHEDKEVTLVMDELDLGLAIEALKKMVKVMQNPASGLHADAMDLLRGFQEIQEQIK